jgi:hypothetical protein
MASQNVDVENIDSEKTNENIPLLMVSVPQMPVGAVAEVELICATQRASSCLSINTISTQDQAPLLKETREENVKRKDTHLRSASEINWDTGYDARKYSYHTTHELQSDCSKRNRQLKIDSVFSYIGNGCAAIGFTTASYGISSNAKHLRLDIVLEKMLSSAVSILKSANLGIFNILHIRLFYTSNPNRDDSLALRSYLQAALSSKFSHDGKYQLPATSFVPVNAMALSPSFSSSYPFITMQFIVADLLHMETEMWIHHNRST